MNLRIVLIATVLMLAFCSCASRTQVFGLQEDPFQIDFEKYKERTITTTLGGTICLTVWEIEDDKVLLTLGDLQGPHCFDKEWLPDGYSKHFAVSGDEFVFTVVKVDNSPEDRHSAVFEITSWDKFQSRCKKEPEGEADAVFTFGAF